MDLVTVKEAAKLLSLSLGAVYALCKAGRLPHVRLGESNGAIRIDRRDLLAYVESCKAGTAVGSKPLATSTAEPQPARRPLPSGGFKHLKVDRLLSGLRREDGPASGRGDRSAP